MQSLVQSYQEGGLPVKRQDVIDEFADSSLWFDCERRRHCVLYGDKPRILSSLNYSRSCIQQKQSDQN
jgi:hypothetical protein